MTTRNNSTFTASRLTPISNRGDDGKFSLPSDGWYHLVPRGEYPVAVEISEGKTEKFIQVIDDRALTAMVNRFNMDSTAPNFAGLLIDQEHFSYDKNKSSEAFGWIKELQNRADGIWGRVEWTDVGEPAVKNGRYRFVSPVWLPDQVEKLGNRRIRPLRLDTAGLTNSPNLRGMVPLSNRDVLLDDAVNPQNQNKKRNIMKSVASKLGLSAEASEEAILAAVTALENRATRAEGDLAPMKNRAEKAETRVTELEGQMVDVTLDKFANRFPKEKREGWKKALIANRDTTVELLEGLPELGKAAAAKPVLNRAAAGTPESKSVETSEVTAAQMDAEVRKIMNRDGIKDFGIAFNRLVQEQPALFARE